MKKWSEELKENEMKRKEKYERKERKWKQADEKAKKVEEELAEEQRKEKRKIISAKLRHLSESKERRKNMFFKSNHKEK